MGTRPGPLNNATLSDYNSAKSEGDIKVMLLAKHTRSKDGPAILTVDAQFQKLMEIYIKKICPRVPMQREQKLFVKDDGDGFLEGTIGKRLSAFFQKSGVRPDKRMSHTDYRKFVATNIQEKAPEGAETVQKVLGHSKKSFERSYVRKKCTETGAKGMQTITTVTSVDTKAKEIAMKCDAEKLTSPHSTNATSTTTTRC